MALEIYMAKMSDHMEAGEIVCWLVQEGEEVEEGQPILEVMTDKAVVEVVAEASGVLKGIREGAEAGAIVPVGETLAFIAAPDEEVPPLPPLGASTVALAAQALPVSPAPGADAAQGQPEQVPVTPAARRVARDLGVDLAQVVGTGPAGRIREEDVRALVAAKRSAGPGEEWLELPAIQRATGQRMLESLQQAPQFALTVDVDMTQALRLRDRLLERILAETGERLSITAILVKIVASALETHPRANASFEEGRLRLHPRRNIGVAVGTDDGLVVPVVKEADRKSLAQVVLELGRFKVKAQQMRFDNEDLSGGTFTVSNLGMYGVDRFTAILNPPQSAILAVGRIGSRPVGLDDDRIALRPMMSMTLTVDHRSMDGVQGARFLAEVRRRLEDPLLAL
jgi:pyruvate dehydrogenase E2 component (dihydrolipoamide acetyltransferase)